MHFQWANTLPKALQCGKGEDVSERERVEEYILITIRVITTTTNAILLKCQPAIQRIPLWLWHMQVLFSLRLALLFHSDGLCQVRRCMRLCLKIK